MSASYYLRASDVIKRFNTFFKGKVFTEINARDVHKFFTALNNYTFENTSAKLKDSAKAKLDEVALAYGVRKADREGLHRPILYAARNAEVISWDFAKEICLKGGLNVNQCFEKIHKVQHYRKETIMKYKRVLSCIFVYAIQTEISNINYASSAYLKNVIAGEKAKEVNILNEQEINSLLDVLKKEHIMHSIPIYLMTMLGLRSCEVAGLEYKDIDWEKRIISVNRDRIYIPRKGVITNSTKTKYSKRDLPICEALFQKLSECKAYYDKLKEGDPDFIDDGVIYRNIDGTLCNPQNINKLLRRFLVKADCRQISSHKLRHSWITRLIGEKVPVNIVSKLAGHANCDITLKVYTHYNKDVDDSKDILEKIFATTN